MDKFIGRWSLYYTATFLVLALTGTFVFLYTIFRVEDARLLTVEEQQIIICGENAQSPGKCNSPPVGGDCNKSNVECPSENNYCETVQKDGLICQQAFYYQNPLRCLADAKSTLRCDEDPSNLVECYFYRTCTCVYQDANDTWICWDDFESDDSAYVGDCINYTLGG